MAEPARKRVVLVGGGHAHLFTLARLPELIRRGANITLVTASRYHYYSGMGPGMLAGTYPPEALRFDVRALAERCGADCIVDRAVSLDPQRRLLLLDESKPVPYDLISFNIGSAVSLPDTNVAGNILPAKPIDNLLRFREQVRMLLAQGTPRLAVIGGGAAGVELAGNLERLVRNERGMAYVSLVAGKRLLERLPEKAGDLARESLANRKIEVIEGKRVVRVEAEGAMLDDGSLLPFQSALVATGITPPPLFRASGLPVAEDGSLLVTDSLQCVDYPEILGGGDCISLAGKRLDRVGVYAVRQAPVIFANLEALLTGKDTFRFTPQARYLQLLNLGDGTALFIRGTTVFRGKSAFFLKDYLDTSFVKTYQAG
jgi:NADH dehydrogenase FAD-containing subunit